MAKDEAEHVRMSRCQRCSGRAEARLEMCRAEARLEMCRAEARPWRCAELRRGRGDVPSCGEAAEMCRAEARPLRCAELRRGCRDVPSCGRYEAVVSRAVARMRQ